MTQEEKQLLLKDLCERQPYGVKCAAVTTNNEPNTIGGYCEVFDDFYIREVDGWFNISIIKPYLRHMSSMTEEEKEEFDKIMNLVEERCINAYGKGGYSLAFTELNDWLNKKMFDYRGLIPMGLALEAPEGMYNIE